MFTGMDSSTALLLFVRRPGHEPGYLGLSHYQEIHSALDQRIRQLAAGAGLPVIYWHEGLQQGSCFGERLSHAVEAAWNAGYERLLLLGNDTPELSGRHIRSALLSLEKGRQVTGHARDGGCYLIGLCRASYNGNDFRRLPWCSPGLGRALTQLLHAEVLGERLADLDSEGALYAFLSLWGKGALKAIFRRLLCLKTTCSFSRPPVFSLSPVISQVRSRGSPAVACTIPA